MRQRAFNAEASLSGSTCTSRNGSRTVYTGTDMRAAMQAALNSLTPNRSTAQRVVVRGSGSMSRNDKVQLFSYTTLDVCGTINVAASGTGDKAPTCVCRAASAFASTTSRTATSGPATP